MPLIPNKREFLARRLNNAGALRWIEHTARRPSLLVLTYHRIGNPSARSDYGPVYSATAARLEAQAKLVRDTYRLLTLDEVVELATERFRGLREPSALITFDDGYRDNFETAFPVLDALRVRATFFLPTGFLQASRLPWWDHIAHVISHCELSVLRLDWPKALVLELGALPRTRAIARVVQVYLDHHAEVDANGGRQFRAHLEDRAGLSLDEAELGRGRFLTWDDARALVDAGMSIGSHARSHRSLASLSEGEQICELAESKRTLEAELGRTVEALAYPYGWPGTFDSTTERLALEAGYKVAFTSMAGVNHALTTTPMAVRRLGVGSADSTVLLRARLALYASVGKSPL
jgi:peptidoglycan/xylan/chitin deacetylase (PgdA/CDA1 family)